MTAATTAKEVLRAAGEPLHVDEITRRALELGWTTAGSTPVRTIAARLAMSTDVTRVDRGTYIATEHLTTEITEWMEENEARTWERRAARLERKGRRGFAPTYNCTDCGRIRAEPAAECDHCGDSAGSWGGDRHEINRAYGHAY